MLKKILLPLFFCFTFNNLFATIYKDSDTILVIEKISISGNKKTKEKIILREIVLKTGDTISRNSLDKKIQESKQNLLNTPLFNFVYFDTLIQKNKLQITIRVEERWYLWPYLVLDFADRNFNEWWKTKDFERLYYGVILTKYNFRGRNEKLDLNFVLGYRKMLSLEYSNFVLDSKRKHSLGFKISQINQNELLYASNDNKSVFFSKELETVTKKQIYSIEYTYRPQIFSQIQIYLAFQHLWVNDSIILLNSRYFPTSNNKCDYLKNELTFHINKCDAKYYPLKGYSLVNKLTSSFVFNKNHESRNNYSFETKFAKFQQLSKKIYLAWSAKIRYLIQKANAYIFEEALGYYDLARGYEYYIIDGDHFSLLKTNLKYAILQPKVKTVKFIRFEKFKKTHLAIYSNLYFDCAYVNNSYTYNYNSFTNKILYSGGIGIDFVTYYDKVLRVEYSVNHLKESGIFIHFVAPIK